MTNAHYFFINLSNHPISTWSTKQLDSARTLGLGEPTELDGGMPLVPPEADEHEVARLAGDIADHAVLQGAAGAFVAGDFNLTVALVRELTNRGIRCFSATTHREAAEQRRPEGTVEKHSVFEFVRWREYR